MTPVAPTATTPFRVPMPPAKVRAVDGDDISRPESPSPAAGPNIPSRIGITPVPLSIQESFFLLLHFWQFACVTQEEVIPEEVIDSFEALQPFHATFPHVVMRWQDFINSLDEEKKKTLLGIPPPRITKNAVYQLKFRQAIDLLRRYLTEEQHRWFTSSSTRIGEIRFIDWSGTQLPAVRSGCDVLIEKLTRDIPRFSIEQATLSPVVELYRLR